MINVSLYIKKDTVFDSGVNTKDENYYIRYDADLITNQYKNYYIRIIDGTGKGYFFKCTSNDNNTLFFDPLPFDLDTTSVFEIYTPITHRIELFKDEKISLTSSIQNSNDIGKLFTDYSQSFTIPASKHNNVIFSHWYESDVDNGYDHRKRYDAFIEVDTLTFKVGNLQLEKSNKANGFIESYTVTFYGNLTQLKDKFKDIKLRDLSTGVFAPFYGTDNFWGLFNHEYNSTQVINRITTSPNLVCYPLIGSQRKYYYKNGIASQDISLTTAPIIWNELFPAVPISAVFQIIQQCFGLTFTGSFFDLDQWTKLHLYLKNSEKLGFLTPPQKLNYDTIVGGAFTQLNLATDVITLDYTVANNYRRVTMNAYINPLSGFETVPYSITVYKNGVVYQTYNDLVGYQEPQLDDLNGNDYTGTIQNFYCTISATSNFQYNCSIAMQVTTMSFSQINYLANSSVNFTISSNINIKNYVPDIKIVDFITGIIKTFNLMVIPTDTDTFEFVPLEMYYNSGKITDITEYCDSQSLEILKPKLYNSIKFEYEKSINVLNNEYKGLYGTEYGDLIYNAESSNESSNYEIKLPFENVMFERTVGENFETASIIDKDLKPYTPKPMLIYLNGLTTVSNDIIITTETGITDFITYNRFSNEYNSLPTDASLSALMTMNFNNEQSPWYNVIAPQGLYYRHYSNYINNLYNIKSRNIKIKAMLPTSLLSKEYGIKLNDRLVISGKRYIINSFTTDLTTGEANFDLITDYRNINARLSIGYRFASFTDVQVDRTEQTISIVIYKNDYDSFQIKAAEDYLIYDTSMDNTTDLLLEVTIPENFGADRTDRIRIDYYNNGFAQLTEYINFLQTAI